LFCEEVYDVAEGAKEAIADLVRPSVEAEGLELFDVEIAGAKHTPVVRVYVERPGGGIDMDAVAAATRTISVVLDEQQPFPGRYTLEVSSPGIDRPLRDIADFETHVGSIANVTLAEPVAGRRRFTGRIESVDGDTIVLDVEDAGEVAVPYAAVGRARLKTDIDFSSTPNKSISEEEEGTS
jgi:ribosome maturation factor RimP